MNMCDTYIVLGNATRSGNVIFGKNSDRLGSEAQLITHSPRLQHSKGESLKCTHITIPQVTETYEVILSQPYWMWGAEMGANEYGVVIGNEAIATKEPLNDTGLLGMDLLRLGLERGKTAKKALDIIINLLETHGQGGSHNKKGLNYHNSYIIADNKEAYVLETAGRWWIVEIVKSFRSISNNISIRGKGDIRREDIIEHAIEQGYCKDENDFDFKMIFSSSPLPDTFPVESRDGCSLNQLMSYSGEISPELMMKFLRTHEPAGICMHQRNSQSTGSQVSEIFEDPSRSIHWFTGSTIPCLSIFKPYTFPINNQKVREAKIYGDINPEWFWARHSEFINEYKKKPTVIDPERERYYQKLRLEEKKLIDEINDIQSNSSNISLDAYRSKIENVNMKAWNISKSLITPEE
jgi:secernin